MIGFKKHLVISILIRIFLIYYGEVQDNLSDVQYTDIDYRVVTDGAGHVLNMKSPYKRQTYRYTPLLAYLMLPNVILHKSFGKFLFSLFDLLIGVLIKWIILSEYKYNKISIERKLLKLDTLNNRNKYMMKRKSDMVDSNVEALPPKYIKMAEMCACFWLYNPLTMVIATRGNGDSITCSLVLASLYFLMKTEQNMRQYFISGLFLGLAIHFRLYPIGFCLAYYLSISEQLNVEFRIPNIKQLLLVLGTALSLSITTGVFFFIYGYEFLFESILYHLIRKDTRHNFSLYFYLQYLNSNFDVTLLEKILTFLPQLIIILLLSIQFGRNRQTLLFGIFCISFIMVAYNPVVTSQYFVWFLSILPLCVKNLRKVSIKKAIFMPIMWFISQGGWLLPAYLLEYKGWNTFEFIWVQSIVFFFSNLLILQMLINDYDIMFNYKTY